MIVKTCCFPNFFIPKLHAFSWTSEWTEAQPYIDCVSASLQGSSHIPWDAYFISWKMGLNNHQIIWPIDLHSTHVVEAPLLEVPVL